MQDPGTETWNLVQALQNGLTIAVTVLVGMFTLVLTIIGILWGKVDKMSDRLSAQTIAVAAVAKKDDDEIWTALNKDIDETREFRERMIETVAALPTKRDHNDMEGRIMSAIRSSKTV